MKEISMHILDIAMNSIKAKATMIEINVQESKINNYLKIIIKDNGVGMSDEMTKQVTNPFFTTRTTRKVGLGLPLLKESCERCNGNMTIHSQLGKGTTVNCFFQRDNIDRAPLGNMGETILTIINSMKSCELIYTYETDRGTFVLSTLKIKKMLDGMDINDNSVLIWIKEFVNENVNSLLLK